MAKKAAANQSNQSDFADDFEIDSLPESASVPKDADGIPYCRKHHCRMKAKSGGQKGSGATYYGCPVSGCEEKTQMIRVKREQFVPAEPVKCCRCGTTCERSQKHSRAAYVVLECPGCGWKSNALPVPQFADQEADFRGKRREIEQIGDR